MISRILCVFALCLLMAGCGTLGAASPRSFDGLRLFPARRQSRASGKSFIRQVEQDPFPPNKGDRRIYWED